MLVLSRCVGEQVVLPDQAVTITVLESRGGRVKIGIDAGPETKILRGELLAIPPPQPGLMAHGSGQELPRIVLQPSSPQKG